METYFNLKRRRDIGVSDKDGDKKQCIPKPMKQQPQLEKQKSQQPMPIQPQKPTENIQRPAQIQNQPQRSAQIIHSPAQHMQKETPLPPILPSLSPITTPKIFSRSRSVNRIGLSPSSSPIHTRTHSETNQFRNPLIGITLCTEPDTSKISDHQLKTILKPLSSFRYINEKNISNPYLFRGEARWPPLFAQLVTAQGSCGASFRKPAVRIWGWRSWSIPPSKKCFLFVRAGSRF